MIIMAVASVFEITKVDMITPKWIYINCGYNWFGSLFCFILLSAFSPICFLVKILYFVIIGIKCSIHWLFTVGRDGDE
jgi:hypothetical protein